ARGAGRSWSRRGAGGSAALEVRGALLLEGPRTFLRVLGAEDVPAVGELVLECLVVAHAVGLAQGAQDRLHGERAVLADGLADLARLVERRAVVDDVADQPQVECLVGADVATGEQQVARLGVGDLTPDSD